MNPIPHPAKTRTLAAPRGQEANVTPLEIMDCEYTGQHSVMSLWKPEPEELKALNEGRPIALFVMGTNMPPVAIHVLGDE